MKKITRVVSVILASAMLVSSSLALGGCKQVKEKKELKYITEDQPWFDSTKIELNPPYDESDFEYIDISEPAYLDGYIYAVFQGYKIYDVKAADDSDFDFDSTTIKSILQYDLDGNFVKELPLVNDQYRVGYCSSLVADGDKLKINCDAYDKKEHCFVTTQLMFDPKTNNLEKSSMNIDISATESVQADYQVGDKKVYLVADFESMSYRFIIEGAKTKSIPINSAVEGLKFVDSCLVIDDNTLLGFCYGKESQTIELKVDSGEIHKSDVEIDTAKYSFSPVQDGKSYAANGEGIFTINDKLEIESVLDYSSTFVNIYDLNYATPLYVDEDLILLSTFNFLEGGMKRNVYAFNRADSNPNVGKKIIDVFSMIPFVTYAEAEAIYEFNENSDEYFATLRFSEFNTSSGDEYENTKAFAKASDQLVIDIMAGDGPDIVLNGFGCNEFNNPNYFVDLNSLMTEDSSYDKTKYFDNVIEASKDDGGMLYQMPASFTVDCIAAKVSDVGEGHIGFTYDDYEKFLDEACNGISPIEGSRNDYLDMCVAAGYFDYLSEGKVDFNNEDFKKACEFANSHFPEKSDRDSMFSIVIGGSSESLDAPQQMDLSVPSIIMSQLGGTPETVGFYGFPAAEEHGPVAYINSSAAISTGISDETKDACWDLIKIMLDDEVQESIKDSFPINRSAMSNLLVSMADDADKSYNTYVIMGYSETEIVTQFNTVKVNRDIIDSFYNSVENITDVSRSNSSLDIVIAEELPAYFAGQKGLDDVISIINDRAQTIYDERK